MTELFKTSILRNQAEYLLPISQVCSILICTKSVQSVKLIFTTLHKRPHGSRQDTLNI